MKMTEKISGLIEESASLNARLARRLKRDNLDILVWVSPSACRDPEETKLWHPLYFKRSIVYKLGIYLYILVRYALAGLVKFFSYKGLYYRHINKRSPTLLVIPDEISDRSAEFRTEYLIEEEGYPVDKLVFSQYKNIGLRFFSLNYRGKFIIFLKLCGALFSDFKETLRKGRINQVYLDAFVIFFRWVISQSWCFHLDFYRLVEEVINGNISDYKTLLCLHEMHFYSRAVWRAARQEGIKGVTAQHAMIIPEKLWYFPHQKEVMADCPLPDVFFVYSDETANNIRLFYPGTKFLLCCSPRFKKWKSARPPEGTGDGKSVLFASGIMFYDASILIRAIKNLLKEDPCGTFKIKLRLHPFGSMTASDKRWVREAVKTGRIEISTAALREELGNSAVVVGCGSAVLQEAILLGIPALAVFSDDFIQPSILPRGKGWNAPVGAISRKRLEEQISRNPDEATIERFRINMGLQNPDLTTKMIYERTELKQDAENQYSSLLL